MWRARRAAGGIGSGPSPGHTQAWRHAQPPCHVVGKVLLCWRSCPVAALLIAVPGPDVMLVVRNATRGRAVGVDTAVGTLGDLLAHAAAATMGLSALVAASATAFTAVRAVKLAAAAYLLYLGVQTLLSGRRDRPVSPAGGGRCRPERVGLAAALREGC